MKNPTREPVDRLFFSFSKEIRKEIYSQIVFINYFLSFRLLKVKWNIKDFNLSLIYFIFSLISYEKR